MKKFKGTKGRYTIYGDKYISIECLHNNGHETKTNPTIATINTTFRELEEAKANAKTMVNGLNVRQEINCDLPELLNQRNELLSSLKDCVSTIEWIVENCSVYQNHLETFHNISVNSLETSRKAIDNIKL